MMEFTTPPSYGSAVVNVGGVARDGAVIVAGCANSARPLNVKADPDNDWPEPSAIELRWTGPTTDGRRVQARIDGPLGDRLDRVDVMAELPGFVKTIVGGVAGTRPYIYQVRVDLSHDDPCAL